MQREVSNIFRQADVNVAWLGTQEGTGAEAYRNVVVLRFDGQCRSVPPLNLRVAATRDELGSSAVRDGAVLPFADIHCDRVSGFLQNWMGGRALGAAVGRVVAHELYHIVTNSLGHGSGPVSKGSVAPGELAARRVTLSPKEIDRLRSSLH